MDYLKHIKQSPIQGLNGLWGGTQGALQQSGGGLPKITTFNELLSSTHANIEGVVTHNGYGFMLYTGVKLGRSASMMATLDTSNMDMVRFVIMGGGGSASADNVRSGSAGAGVEGTIDTSSMDTLQLRLGSGGAGFSGAGSGAAADSSSQGGISNIYLTDDTEIAKAEGGLVAGYTGTGNANGGYTTRPTTTFNSTYVSAISRADGGQGGHNNTTSAQRSPNITLSPTITGAYAHGASAGRHGEDLHGDTALGYGGGGGGTDGSTYSPGGPLGYRGGRGASDGGDAALGPNVTTGTSFGKNSIGYSGYTHPWGGGGGGAYGGGGIEVYDVGQGATGLVKIWWASNTGDASVLATTGNLYA